MHYRLMVADRFLLRQAMGWQRLGKEWSRGWLEPGRRCFRIQTSHNLVPQDPACAPIK
jgi:hypothetical protein